MPTTPEIIPKAAPQTTSLTKCIPRRTRLTESKTPKNATVAEYRAATGMEVLFGYLFAAGDEARLTALFEIGYEENTV
jgi:23S rRNA maturation mini-RNase III